MNLNSHPSQITKRDGTLTSFDSSKILSAIQRSGEATTEFGLDEAKLLTAQVIKVLAFKFEEKNPSVEDVQDIVESILISANHPKTARAYAVYRSQRDRVRKDKNAVVNVAASINEYLDRLDWRVNANANQGYSLGGLILNVSGKVVANYWLNHIYSPEAGKAHRDGDIHIHDLDMLSGYCAGWSLRTLLTEGFNGVPNKVESNPPKHLSSAVGQIVNFLGTLQNEWAGAQAFSSFDTYMAPFIKKDGLSYKEVRQCIQELIYNLNVPSRWGCVDTETEVLSVDGWKRYDELTEEDTIYTWKDGKLNTCKVNKVVVKPYKGVLHSYQGRNYNQLVTPNHRVLTFDHNSRQSRIRVSEEIFSAKTPYSLPVRFMTGSEETSCLSDDEIKLAAMLYADGSFDFRKGVIHKVSYHKSENRFGGAEFERIAKVLGLQFTTSETLGDVGVDAGYPEYQISKYTMYADAARKVVDLVGQKTFVDKKFLEMDARQSELFLNTWMLHDGDEFKELIQCDNSEIIKSIQHIALRAGRTSYIRKRNKTTWAKLRKVEGIIPTSRVEVDYDGLVWCPNVEDGTAVFRKNGSVYISGQTQTPFTNLTFDWTCPEDLADQNPVIGGEEMPFTYGDLQDEMAMINKAYIEVMTEGDAKGRIFTFPIPTYNITKDFTWDSPNADILFEMTAKYGLPYFQNFLKSDLEPKMVRSMCCRLQLDLSELLKRGNGLFGSAEQTGSIGVVTINCARLGHLYKTAEEVFAATDNLLNIARSTLEVKRKEVQRLMDAGLYPFTKRYLGTLRNHFSTIGVNGINEMICNFTNGEHDITTELGEAIAVNFLDHIRKRMTEFQEETGHLYNLEATPAEGTTYRFAKEDQKRFGDKILQAGVPSAPYYTNSSQLPVDFTTDPYEALERQETLQRKYTGGTVLHLYMGERISNAESCKKLVKTALSNYALPYITITPTFSICPTHGYLAGEQVSCPTCGEATEIWTRVMGYHRPKTSFNIGKKSEYNERICFQEPQ